MKQIVELERLLSRATMRAEDAERALSKLAGQLSGITGDFEARWAELREEEESTKLLLQVAIDEQAITDGTIAKIKAQAEAWRQSSDAAWVSINVRSTIAREMALTARLAAQDLYSTSEATSETGCEPCKPVTCPTCGATGCPMCEYCYCTEGQ